MPVRAIILDCFGVLVAADELYRKQVNDELMAWVKKLSNKFIFAVLSNTSREWFDSYVSSEQQKVFTGVFLSGETGRLKPGPDTFTQVSSTLGVPTKQCLFVDDSPVNLQGAEAVGMQTLLYKNMKQFEQDSRDLLK